MIKYTVLEDLIFKASRLLGLIFFLCQIFTPGKISAQIDSTLKSQIDKIIFYDTDISFDKIPGFTIGILDHDSSYIFNYGDTNKLKLSDSSVYEIGGLSKIFAAHICNILHNQKSININDPLNAYLPEDFRNIKLNKITIRNLLTHSSGLIIRPDNLGLISDDPDNPYKNYKKVEVLEYLKNITNPLDTGSYLYSHLNYALLEIIMEGVTSKNYEELLKQYIFTPSGMTDSYITSLNDHISPGFDRSGRKATRWTFESFAASEGIKSSCRDLISYVSNLMSAVYPEDSFKNLFNPYLKIPASKKTYVAGGWHLFKNRKNQSIYLHSGKTGGHAASIHFKPDTKTAVILLTNSPGKMDGLATLVLRMINNNWKRKS